MTKLALPSRSTIASIKAGLSEDYVRAVLQNTQDCERVMGDAVVVISLTDGVSCPNYSIDAIMDLQTGERMNWRNFSGRTHRPLTETQEQKSIWSEECMTHSILSVLLGEIRGFKRP
jgi:hypothetical protein